MSTDIILLQLLSLSLAQASSFKMADYTEPLFPFALFKLLYLNCTHGRLVIQAEIYLVKFKKILIEITRGYLIMGLFVSEKKSSINNSLIFFKTKEQKNIQ